MDGSDPATDWQGLLTVEESPHLLDPKSGYLFNVNDSPWTGAGESSLHKQDYPAYVETGTESARGLHALRLLQGSKDFTLDSLVTAAYDSYLPWFIKPLSRLIHAWENLPASSEAKVALAGQIGCAATMGPALGREFRSHFISHLLGPGDREGGSTSRLRR